jgi:hypothetical protein
MDGQPQLDLGELVAKGTITKGATNVPAKQRQEANAMEQQENYEVPQRAYEIHTIMGLSWQEVRNTMQAELPTGAYKQADKSFLTDISPAYLTEILDKCFGPCGYGWWLDVPEPPSVQLSSRYRKDGSEVWEASVDRAWLRYRLVVNGEEIVAAIPTSGGNVNDDRGYAVKGAMTKAIGSAASKLLWQLAVYKGELTHRGDKRKKSKGGGGGSKIASQSQRDFINGLLDQLGVASDANVRDATIKAKGFPALAELGGKQASELIGRLKAAVEAKNDG